MEGSAAAVTGDSHRKALSCAVPKAGRDLVGDKASDYSDAFVIGLPAGDAHSAEVWARAMFTPTGPVWNTFAAVWAAATGVQPPRHGKRLGFFRVVTPDPRAAVHIADGPRYRIHLVVLVGEGRMTFATFVTAHRTIWRHVLKGIMVAHRRVAPLLMERALGLLSSTG
jgi:hypothetical protein